jgi:hypothetical protein
MGQRIDTLVVPVTGELGELGNKVQLLSATAAGRASRLPRLVCLCLEGSRREMRTRLIELGITLTGNVARAELATSTALTLI